MRFVLTIFALVLCCWTSCYAEDKPAKSPVSDFFQGKNTSQDFFNQRPEPTLKKQEPEHDDFAERNNSDSNDTDSYEQAPSSKESPEEGNKEDLEKFLSGRGASQLNRISELIDQAKGLNPEIGQGSGGIGNVDETDSFSIEPEPSKIKSPQPPEQLNTSPSQEPVYAALPVIEEPRKPIFSVIVSYEPESRLRSVLQELDHLARVRGATIGKVVIVGNNAADEEAAARMVAKQFQSRPSDAKDIQHMANEYIDSAVSFATAELNRRGYLPDSALPLERLQELYGFTTSPTWVVTYKGKEYVYEGIDKISTLFRADGEFR